MLARIVPSRQGARGACSHEDGGPAADGYPSGEHGAQRSGGGAGRAPTACPSVMWPRTARVHLLAALSGVCMHGTGSSRHLAVSYVQRGGHFSSVQSSLSDHVGERGGGVGPPRPAARRTGTNLAPIHLCNRDTIGRARASEQRLPPCAGTPPTPWRRVSQVLKRPFPKGRITGCRSHLEKHPRAVVHYETA